MQIHAPSRFENSFFQQKAAPELKSLDLWAKRTLGKWKRRKSILQPWSSIVDDAVTAREDLEELSDGEINQRIEKMRHDITSVVVPNAQSIALLSEVARRELGLTPYPVQMLSALALINGYLAEIDTGEGKTLSIALAAAFESWKGEPVHVITANDYLATRDAKTMGPLYQRLGISVASVVGETQPGQRREGYRADITYTTAKEVSR